MAEANRAMFWRILRRLLFAHRSRLFVILLALVAGATVTAALLNLQLDAKRRLTTEFRALGANVIIAPRGVEASAESLDLLDDTLFTKIPGEAESGAVVRAEFLYGVADVSAPANQQDGPATKNSKIILAGVEFSGSRGKQLLPASLHDLSSHRCGVGQRAASVLQLRANDEVVLSTDSQEMNCVVFVLPATGGQEDSQIFTTLGEAQSLLEKPRQISLIQLSVPGTAPQVQTYISALQQRFPGADVHGIRQFTEGEAKIYNRISGVLNATVVVVLILTSLCVMAAMTNVAMERRNDVGLMKAIGGASRRVLRLFLAEATLLGFVGGLLGAAAGIVLSMWLGKAVFGLAARPRLIVYPVSVASTVLVSIAGAFPLRRLVSIRPGSVFRGEA